MNYREMIAKLKGDCVRQLARRSSWPDPSDRVAYILNDNSLERRENGKWVPYTPDEADGVATDWELVSTYSY